MDIELEVGATVYLLDHGYAPCIVMWFNDQWVIANINHNNPEKPGVYRINRVTTDLGD